VVNRGAAEAFFLVLMLLIMILILRGSVVSRKDHEHDQDHEQEYVGDTVS